MYSLTNGPFLHLQNQHCTIFKLHDLLFSTLLKVRILLGFQPLSLSFFGLFSHSHVFTLHTNDSTHSSCCPPYLRVRKFQ